VLLNQWLGALGGLLLGLPVLGLSGGLLLAVVAGLLPLMRLRDRVRLRQHAILRALPWQLDLLTLAVEAGLEFSQAVDRLVARAGPGPLTEAWARWLADLRLGVSREAALRSMADGMGLPAMHGLVSALVQADRHGSRLGRVLRLQAAQLREERRQRAEKAAGEAPVKMLFPLLGCIFPTVFLVLFGPILYGVLHDAG